MNPLHDFLNLELIHLKTFTLTVADVCSSAFVVFLAWAFMYLLKRYVLQLFFRRRNVAVGHQYAVTQLIKYLVYPITMVLSLQALGIQLSVFLAGAAALLVGIGLGLQQTFKDLFSGIILLIEGTVKVDDMVVIDHTIVMVKEIGLRPQRLKPATKSSRLCPTQS